MRTKLFDEFEACLLFRQLYTLCYWSTSYVRFSFSYLIIFLIHLTWSNHVTRFKTSDTDIIRFKVRRLLRSFRCHVSRQNVLVLLREIYDMTSLFYCKNIVLIFEHNTNIGSLIELTLLLLKYQIWSSLTITQER